MGRLRAVKEHVLIIAIRILKLKAYIIRRNVAKLTCTTNISKDEGVTWIIHITAIISIPQYYFSEYRLVFFRRYWFTFSYYALMCLIMLMLMVEYRQ